jgi:transcriptional regulator with GAF, ATPase, and Fis domain
MDYERQSIIDMLRRLGGKQAADAAARELPERFSRQELEEFAERHGISSRDELTDLMGGSP